MGKQVAARLYGGVAQLGEHLPCKQGVKSSNLSISICTKAMSHARLRHRFRCACTIVKLWRKAYRVNARERNEAKAELSGMAA